MRVRLQSPTRHDRDEFLERVAASRVLHRSWVSPPADPRAYRGYLARNRDSRHAAFLVRRSQGGELVGVVNLNEIVRGGFQNAFLGFYAFVPHQGQGLLREAVALTLSRAFGPLGLHRVEANIQPTNTRSRELVRRLGFTLEGLSPRYLKVSGRWCDHERWALRSEQHRRPRRKR